MISKASIWSIIFELEFNFSMNLKEIRNHIKHANTISTTNRQFQRFIKNFIEPFKNCFDEFQKEIPVFPGDSYKLSKAGIPIMLPFRPLFTVRPLAVTWLMSHRINNKLKVPLSFGTTLKNFYHMVSMMNLNQLKIALPPQPTYLYSKPMNTMKAFMK